MLHASVVLDLVSSVRCQKIGLEQRLRNELFRVKQDIEA